VDIPAYHVVPGEEVRVAPGSRELVAVKLAQEAASRGQPVAWLSVDADKAAGRMTERPTREAIPINAQEQLIVELYSK
jgi:small subunit ribosomal protein S4